MTPAARMDMPVGLMSEATPEERIESLLITIACALTSAPPHRIAPWLMT
jgi:hypothetical protein